MHNNIGQLIFLVRKGISNTRQRKYEHKSGIEWNNRGCSIPINRSLLSFLKIITVRNRYRDVGEQVNALTPFDIPDINSNTDFMADPVFTNSSLFGITNVRKIVTVTDTWEHVAYENTIDENRSSPVRSRWPFLIVPKMLNSSLDFIKNYCFGDSVSTNVAMKNVK